uniref:Fork-head domain-containing protein n=1 Tax=Globodera pallida TaxID=36090 RepID=A0A183C6G6_GLOPA
MEAGETILSVPPLLHLLTIQQQQQKGNSAQKITPKAKCPLPHHHHQTTKFAPAANANVVKQEANNNNKSASAGLASDEEDRLEHKQQLLSQDDEDDDFVGKLEIVENSTTPLPHYLQIQIPPVSGAAFVRGRHHHLHTASSLLIPTDDPSTPTDQALKALPVIKLPWDEKEERPSLSYKDLIIEAIESSPERRLKLSEIYQVAERFQN